MPSRPPRPCSAPGCPALTTARYCPAHAHLAQQAGRAYDQHRRRHDPALALAARLRNSARWKKLTAIVAAQEPLCRDPFGTHAARGVPAPGAQTHHIEPLATHPELAFVRENLARVCTACHAHLEAMERRGHKTAHFFVNSRRAAETPSPSRFNAEIAEASEKTPPRSLCPLC